MDDLTNKKYVSFDYTSRYTGVPYYFNTRDQKEICGLGTNLFTNTSFVSYTVKQEDTLDSLALTYYNNPTYWWVIAYFNNIQDSLKPLTVGEIIKIPNIADVNFGNERH